MREVIDLRAGMQAEITAEPDLETHWTEKYRDDGFSIEVPSRVSFGSEIWTLHRGPSPNKNNPHVIVQGSTQRERYRVWFPTLRLRDEELEEMKREIRLHAISWIEAHRIEVSVVSRPGGSVLATERSGPIFLSHEDLRNAGFLSKRAVELGLVKDAEAAAKHNLNALTDALRQELDVLIALKDEL